MPLGAARAVTVKKTQKGVCPALAGAIDAFVHADDFFAAQPWAALRTLKRVGRSSLTGLLTNAGPKLV